MFDEDLDGFLADHGVPCTAGGFAFTGMLDAPGEVITVGIQDVVSNDYQLTVTTATIGAAAIRYGTAISVAGVSYMAKVVVPVDDGAFSSIHLSRV